MLWLILFFVTGNRKNTLKRCISKSYGAVFDEIFLRIDRWLWQCLYRCQSVSKRNSSTLIITHIFTTPFFLAGYHNTWHQMVVFQVLTVYAGLFLGWLLAVETDIVSENCGLFPKMSNYFFQRHLEGTHFLFSYCVWINDDEAAGLAFQVFSQIDSVILV